MCYMLSTNPCYNSILARELATRGYFCDLFQMVYLSDIANNANILFLRLTTGKIEKEYSPHATAMKFIG